MAPCAVMRILHLTRDLPPASKGGISTAVGGLLEALVAAGHGCAALSFDGWRPSARGPSGAPLALGAHHGAPVGRLQGPEHLEEAMAFARAQAPDLLHVHHGMLWPFAAELRSALGVPAVFTVHVHQATLNRLREVTEPTMSSEGQARALREADAVLAPSSSCEAAIRVDAPECPVWTTPLGIFDTSRARDAVASRTIGGSTGPLLYVGRFADVKGTAEFFALARQALARWPSLEVVVVGGVPDNPRAERRWRRRWEEDTAPDVIARLRFAGWCDPEALSEHYASARALVVPSWTETFGLTVLEGMLHGVPIVASDCPAIAELIDDGRTGLLARSGTPASLIACVERILDDGPLAFNLGQAGAVEARKAHRWEEVVTRTTAAYARVCEAGPMCG